MAAADGLGATGMVSGDEHDWASLVWPVSSAATWSAVGRMVRESQHGAGVSVETRDAG